MLWRKTCWRCTRTSTTCLRSIALRHLNNFNSVAGGDLQDWKGPAADAFNAFGPMNEQDDMTTSDLIAMDVIGYSLVPEPGSGVLILAGLAMLGAMRVPRRSEPAVRGA